MRNRGQLIPFHELGNLQLASVSLGTRTKSPFQETLEKFGVQYNYQLSNKGSISQQNRVLKLVEKKDVVIVGLHNLNSSLSKNYGITSEERNFINKLRESTRVILVVFGTPYALKDFDDIEWVLNAYRDDPVAQSLAAQGLFGVFGFKGRLPITASPLSTFGAGFDTQKLFRLGFSSPEVVGFNPDVLESRIDHLANEAISKKATPGCVVLVAKDGKIVFEKAYGHHTYSRRRKMKTDDIFDLASITKVAATTLSVMKLHDEGKVNIYQPMSTFLPPLVNTNKSESNH